MLYDFMSYDGANFPKFENLTKCLWALLTRGRYSIQWLKRGVSQLVKGFMMGFAMSVPCEICQTVGTCKTLIDLAGDLHCTCSLCEGTVRNNITKIEFAIAAKKDEKLMQTDVGDIYDAASDLTLYVDENYWPWWREEQADHDRSMR
jgi:hypothetical protein